MAQFPPRGPARALSSPARPFVLAAALSLVVVLGCASTEYVRVRSTPRNPLIEQLKLTSRGGPRPSERTLQTLRQVDLHESLDEDPRSLLNKLQGFIDREPTAERIYAFAELSYLGGKKLEPDNEAAALDLYGSAVARAYLYLFDEEFTRLRNPYDPQFRGACDLYNAALESSLRMLKRRGGLLPGSTHSLSAGGTTCSVTITPRNVRWRPEDFGRFEFVSDYAVQNLSNHYQSFGLGVPLIAVRDAEAADSELEKYYPPNLSFPVTAFMRLLPHEGPGGGGQRYHAVVELYDPLAATDILIRDRRVPLESDLSTPLGYFLNDPRLNALSTFGFLRPDQADQVRGLYMLQPYEPGKIPVLMIHGLWSSPLTWMEMFNDLRSDQKLRDRYQFWFYLYPTGQPFWETARQLRGDLAAVRQVVDPLQSEPALDQMVLVGHSMGGLVAKLQVLESGQDYWRLVSDAPFEQVIAEPPERDRLQGLFFFNPNPSVRRLITLGTPHRGSRFANEATRWLAQKLITLPQMTLMAQQKIYRDNPGLFRDRALVDVKTSLDSLAPDSPILPVMLGARLPPWVRHHNVAGVIPDSGWLHSIVGEEGGTDGVVAYRSAHVDNVASELVVPADHVRVHQHPLAVLEVRRVLLEHLAELDGGARLAGSATAPPGVVERLPPVGAGAASAARPAPVGVLTR